MSNLRELTDAELDIVGGGVTAVLAPRPTNPLVVIFEDVIRIVEEIGGTAPAPKRVAY